MSNRSRWTAWWRRRRHMAEILFSLSIALGSSGSLLALAQTGVQVQHPNKAELAKPLLAKTLSAGRLRVIVGLHQSHQPEGVLEANAAQGQRRRIARGQQALLEQLSGYDVTTITNFEYIPYMAVEVDVDALQTLIDSDDVATIEEDIAVPPTLSSTIPVVGADDAHALGFTGSGQTVAILDTGIEGLHGFFGGRIVSEACYSNAFPSSTRATLCPNGLQTQLGSGSAEATIAACLSGGNNICRHGSHVAGIAAGNGSTSSGVAKTSNIIAIQVFTRFNSASECAPSSAPCVKSYTSDQISGLQRVYALRNTYNIAAINMSLGGGKFTSQSSCDSANASIKSVIDLLRSVNIATVISSGNDAFTDGLGAPGCISSAISVGATTDFDTVAWFSNSASFLDLLAPGVNVTSSVPNNTFASFNGTSMAAPHVTGAWAVYKQLLPTSSVATVEAALKANGKSVTDARNGITKPRLDIGKTITSTAGSPAAEVTSLYAVSGANVGGPARLWAHVKNTGSVTLPSDAKVSYFVNGPSWSGSHDVGTTSVAGLAPGASRWYYLDWTIVCGRSPGNYSYWVRVIRGTGTPVSSWNGPQSFSVGSSGAAEIESLWPVSGATSGGTARLWALVRNTGCSALPADAKVQYWVDGPFWAGGHIVGTTSVAGLVPGAAQWKLFNWPIAASRPGGNYSYWAQAVRGTSTVISPWRGPQNFLVTGLGFNSTFTGSFAPWQIRHGAWSAAGSNWFYTAGVPGQVSSVSYPQDFANFDYEARFWRTGSQTSNASRLIVRGAPNPLDATNKRWNKAYLFQITRSGFYSVWKSNGTTQTPIQNWTSSSAVHASGWNTLRVRAVGSSLHFYINGSLVWSGADPTFGAGEVGIGMYAGPESTGNGFWVDYAKLTVLTPSGTLASSTEGKTSDTTSAAEEVSAEQLSLNEAANAIGQGTGTADDAPES